MATIINPGIHDLRLPAGHVVPARGDLVTTNEALRGDNAAMLNTMALAGQVVLTFDPEPDQAAEVLAKAVPEAAEEPAAAPAETPTKKLKGA